MTDYIDILKEKKTIALEREQLKSSLLVLANILTEANTKAPRDLSDTVKQLNSTIVSAVKDLRNDTTIPDKIANDYKRVADYVLTAISEQSNDLKDIAKDIVKAVEGIKLPEMPTIPKMPEVKIPAFPKIDIPAPIVNIPENDFSPIARAIEGLKTEQGIDLSVFRPHDIDDVDDMQYIGFVAPSGQWYIIENQVKENSLRYTFGKDDYTAAFKKAGTFKYRLLSEAIHAL
jgi:hypothetical protein